MGFRERGHLMGNELSVNYQVGSERVVLNPKVVREYLVSGGGTVSDQEIIFFMKMCKARNLNPWIRDAYLIKYGSKDTAAMVIGKDAFLRRAQANSKYKGHVVTVSEDGQQATAKVYVDGYEVPISVTVDFEEYAGRKQDGKLNRMWAGKPKTMLKKCALVAALREAFVEDLGGMYTADEIHTDEAKRAVSMPQELPGAKETAPVDTREPGAVPDKQKRKNGNGMGKEAFQEEMGNYLDALGKDKFFLILCDLGFDAISQIVPNKYKETLGVMEVEASKCH